MHSLSNNLKLLRVNHRLSQQGIADAIGVPVKTYQAWENRNVEPSFDRLVELAGFYNITVDQLLKVDPQTIGKHWKNKSNKLIIGFAAAPEHIKNAIISLLNL